MTSYLRIGNRVFELIRKVLRHFITVQNSVGNSSGCVLNNENHRQLEKEKHIMRQNVP